LRDLEAWSIECVEVTAEVMAHISDTETPQGLIAVMPMPDLPIPSTISLALILDGVADPGNLGTILRTSAAAGVDVVILAPHCVDPYNPKVLRSAMGAHFRVPIARKFWPDISLEYGSLPTYLADTNGKMIYHAVDWTRPTAVIIGGEARGADPRMRQLAGATISIPMSNSTDSLNAAVAAGVLLFEIRRQRTADSA
jgi:TrmH family RNA methyltransferase